MIFSNADLVKMWFLKLLWYFKNNNDSDAQNKIGGGFIIHGEGADDGEKPPAEPEVSVLCSAMRTSFFCDSMVIE